MDNEAENLQMAPGIQSDFLNEARRIIDEGKRRNLTLRLLGATAFRLHCPRFLYFQELLGRTLSDMDFASLSSQSDQIRRFFLEIGYTEKGHVNKLLAGQRMIFYKDANQKRVDVFYDRLTFNHVIDLRDRLQVDYPTLSVSDLFLEKMQVVFINEKDLIDAAMLLREHQVAPQQLPESIDARYIASICGRDWGWWRTLTGNLQKLESAVKEMKKLGDEDRNDIRMKIAEILAFVEHEPKSTKWKMRARIGDRVRWYNEVEDIERGLSGSIHGDRGSPH